MSKEETINRIAILRTNLQHTDYQAIKFAEGLISEEDYSNIRNQRQNWRVEINQLEKSLEEEPKGD